VENPFQQPIPIVALNPQMVEQQRKQEKKQYTVRKEEKELI